MQAVGASTLLETSCICKLPFAHWKLLAYVIQCTICNPSHVWQCCLYIGLYIYSEKIGWRGFHKESIHANKRRWKIVNFLYPMLMVLLLLYTYMYEILACEWKLNIATDSKVCFRCICIFVCMSVSMVF